MGLMHATWALTYANVVRMLASDKDIEKMTGTQMSDLIFYLQQDQQKAIQKLAQVCPTIQPKGIYAIDSGWMH
jgi:hypothetical protein